MVKEKLRQEGIRVVAEVISWLQKGAIQMSLI